MRRFAAALTAFMLFGASALAADMELTYGGTVHRYQQDDVFIEVNGERIKTEEMPPILYMNRTMVPVREVFEAVGGKVGWNGDTKQVTISYDGVDIALTAGSHVISLGKSRYTIPDDEPAPMLINNKTMVPVRVVSDLLGLDVNWDANSRVVSIGGAKEAQPSAGSQPAQPAKPSDGSVISSIWLEKDGGLELVHMTYGDPVRPTIERYSNSERVVLDFAGATLDSGTENLTFNGNIITGLRAANHDDKVRIVLDVKNQPNLEIGSVQGGIVIAVSAASGAYTTKINDLHSGSFDPSQIQTSQPQQPDPDAGQVELSTEGIEDKSGNVELDYGTVVIDAGHGGSTGAVGGGIKEDDITLAIALKTRDRLKAAGYNVVMTREKDVRVELQTRVDIASKPSSGNKIPALFVSIHCNSLERDSANGTQVYYHPDSKYGTILAQNIYNRDVALTGLKAFNIHDGSTLFVIRKTLQPAALVETAFISNPNDRAYLTSAAGQDAFAQGITEGIIMTLDQMKAERG